MLVFEWAFFVVLLLFCLLCGTAGVLCAACCVMPGCSVRPPSTAHDLPGSVWSLCVPVGGGPPARSPHASLRLGVIDLEARPGPATTHRHRNQALRSLRRPPHQWGRIAVRQLYASSRSPSRPFRRPRAPQPGPDLDPVPRPPPLTPSPSPPALTPLIPEPTPNFACNSPDTTSNLELRSLELQRFRTMLKLLPIELHATFLERRH